MLTPTGDRLLPRLPRTSGISDANHLHPDPDGHRGPANAKGGVGHWILDIHKLQWPRYLGFVLAVPICGSLISLDCLPLCKDSQYQLEQKWHRF